MDKVTKMAVSQQGGEEEVEEEKREKKEQRQTAVPAAVILPAIDQLAAAVGSLRGAVASEDVSAARRETAKTEALWKLVGAALKRYTGDGGDDDGGGDDDDDGGAGGVTTTSSFAPPLVPPNASFDPSPFGSAPRGNTMSEAALVMSGVVLPSSSYGGGGGGRGT